MNNRQIGDLGEQTAINFLKKQNYKILARNYRCRYGEIDIIAVQGKTIAFIEVKTRSSIKFGKGCETVNYRKQQKIKKTALFYLNTERPGSYDLRFDVIDILMKIEGEKTAFKIEHIVNAF